MQVNSDGFLRFADYFFDGLFTDWAVMDKLDNAQQQVKRTQDQVSGVIDQFQQTLQSQIDELVVQA